MSGPSDKAVEAALWELEEQTGDRLPDAEGEDRRIMRAVLDAAHPVIVAEIVEERDRWWKAMVYKLRADERRRIVEALREEWNSGNVRTTGYRNAADFIEREFGLSTEELIKQAVNDCEVR